MQVAVGIRSAQTEVERDCSGAIIRGDAAAAKEHDDTWIFERAVDGKGAPWKLAARVSNPPANEYLAQKPPKAMQDANDAMWLSQKLSMTGTWGGMLVNWLDKTSRP